MFTGSFGLSGTPRAVRLLAKASHSTTQLILDPPGGVSEGGKITLLPGMSPAEAFATLVYECAHEMLYRKKTERKSQNVKEKLRRKRLPCLRAATLDSKPETPARTTFSFTVAMPLS